jgi:hypothetical protein
MCQQPARALRDLLAQYRNPHLQRPTLYPQKIVCQNLIMGQSYGLCKIFFQIQFIICFPNMAISSAKPYVAAPGASLAGKPMGAQS